MQDGAMDRKPRIAFLCLPGLETFLSDIVSYFKLSYDVKTFYKQYTKDTEQELFGAIQWADIVWFEWANELLIRVSTHPSPALNDKHVIVRLHSYEALSGYIGAIDWKKVNDVIFVAEHVRNFVADQWASFPKEKQVTNELQVYVIPNGVDVNRWPFADHNAGVKIAMLANISHKKGPMFLLHAFHSVWKKDNSYQLHIGGAGQDVRYMLYYRYMVPRLGLNDAVFFSGSITDVPKFFDDKRFVICTSPWEGCPVGLLEAMAMGVKPLIHNFVGAERQYPKDWIWNTFEDLTHILTTPYDSQVYRDYVKMHFGLSEQLAAIEQVVKSALTKKRPQITVENAPGVSQIDEIPGVKHRPVTNQPQPKKREVLPISEESDDIIAQLEQHAEKEIGIVEKTLPDPRDKRPGTVDLSKGQAQESLPSKLNVQELIPVAINQLAHKSIQWIKEHPGTAGGVALTNVDAMTYPEVTGYLIPTLLQWKENALAIQYARSLLKLQNANGSWNDAKGQHAFAFDTVQIIRGFVSLVNSNAGHVNGLRDSIDKGVSWLIQSSFLKEPGRLLNPSKDSSAWYMGTRGFVPEAVHMYCVEPIRQAGVLLNNESYIKFSDQVGEWLFDNLISFSLNFDQPNMLSHFYCYIMEALIECGQEEMARKGMMDLEQYKINDFYPAYSNVKWVCSTGQAQAAIVWTKLGETHKAKKTLSAMALLQSANGGFYGSFGVQAEYFQRSQISWAAKFFLDACHLIYNSSTMNPKEEEVIPTPISQKPKTLVVVPNDPLQSYVDAGYNDQTDYFNPLGYWDQVFCLSPQESKAQLMYGMQVIPTWAVNFADEVKRVGTDLVRIYDLRVCNILLNKEQLPVPVICSVHDVKMERISSQWQMCDAFIAISPAIKDFLINEVGVDPNRWPIYELPNRVDTNLFKRLPAEGVEWENFCKRFPGKYRVLHIGRRDEYKNLETVIQAIAKMDDTCGIFIGRGYNAPYMELVEKYNLQERCHFIEAVAHIDLPKYYSWCDCLCNPSKKEGFGMVFIEAMACGCPVVTTNMTPMNTMIADGMSGILVDDPLDVEQVKDGILRAFNPRFQRVIQEGAPKAIEKFSKARVDELEVEIMKTAANELPKRRLKLRRITSNVSSEFRIGDYEVRMPDPKEWEGVVNTSRDSWLYHTWDEQQIFRDAWNAESHSFMIYKHEEPLAVFPLQRHLGNPGLLCSTILGPAGLATIIPCENPEFLFVWNVAITYLKKKLAANDCAMIQVSLPRLAHTHLYSTKNETLLADLGFQMIPQETCVLLLDGKSKEDIFRCFRKDTKQRIKKMIRAGVVTIREARQHEGIGLYESDMDLYYKLHVATYQRTGIKPHPKAYFDLIWEYFGKTHRCKIWFACVDDVPIAALNIALWRNTAVYWTSASDKKQKKHDANRLLQWHAIQWMIDNGITYYEVGEIFPDTKGGKLKGLSTFKTHFGGITMQTQKGILKND